MLLFRTCGRNINVRNRLGSSEPFFNRSIFVISFYFTRLHTFAVKRIRYISAICHKRYIPVIEQFAQELTRNSVAKARLIETRPDD